MPAWMFRKTKTKMQLDPRDEENLGMDLMGSGFKAHYSWVHEVPVLREIIKPKLDFAYGVCVPPLLPCFPLLLFLLSTAVLAPTPPDCTDFTAICRWAGLSTMSLPS
jgi:hypothetical protein